MAFFLQIYFGVMLTVAGLSKFKNQPRFVTSLRLFGLKSFGITRFSSVFVPTYEIFLGALLIMGWYPEIMALFNIVTFVIFLGAKIYLTTRNVKDCGCFGEQQKTSVDAASLTTSVIFVLLALLNLAFANQFISSELRFIAFGAYLIYVVFCITNILKDRQLLVLGR